jgi:hypothetical protein
LLQTVVEEDFLGFLDFSSGKWDNYKKPNSSPQHNSNQLVFAYLANWGTFNSSSVN